MNRVMIMFVLLLMIMVVPSFASVDTTEKAENTETVDDKVIDTSEQELESNFKSKAYQIDGSDKNNYLVEGGNENAINSLATNQNTAQGSVIESTNIEGETFDLELKGEEEKSTKNPVELRQFISFKTKSGKVFHLIIDHSKTVDNVIMLTEVGEQDLLNLIEENAEVALVLGDQPSGNVAKPVEFQNEANEVVETTELESRTEETKDNTSMIIILAASVIAGIAGWYFKIYKPKHITVDDEVDEADYIDDEVFEEDED